MTEILKISRGYLNLRFGAGGGIRTHEPLRDRVLSPAPLTWLGNPRWSGIQSNRFDKASRPPEWRSPQKSAPVSYRNPCEPFSSKNSFQDPGWIMAQTPK